MYVCTDDISTPKAAGGANIPINVNYTGERYRPSSCEHIAAAEREYSEIQTTMDAVYLHWKGLWDLWTFCNRDFRKLPEIFIFEY